MTLPLFDNDDAGAVISGAYRYRLWRRLGPGDRTAVFVMLNPSTADARVNDPTIRKCLGFATRWGFDRLEVVNLYAYRATDPGKLWRVDDPVGTDNDRMIRAICTDHPERIVCAWGAHAGRDRALEVHDMLVGAGLELHRLSLTKDGQPGHPLMLAYTTPCVRWTRC